MACSTCSHSMQSLGNQCFWCPRCGTIRQYTDLCVPSLVDRCRELSTIIDSNWIKAKWHTIGIAESINLPENRT